MFPTKCQAIIIIHASTAGVVRISSWLSKNRFRLGNDPGVDVGKLQPGSGILPRWRELDTLDWTRVIGGVVGDGEIVEEVVFGVGSIASIGFDKVGWVVPEAEEDAVVALFHRTIGAIRFVGWTSWTSWCCQGEG
jgi:hypothetical protein